MECKQIAGERIAGKHITQECAVRKHSTDEYITQGLAAGNCAASECSPKEAIAGNRAASECSQNGSAAGNCAASEYLTQEDSVQNDTFCADIIQKYVESYHEETITLLKELAVIPAPSGQEEKRAAFVLEWLHKQGATEAFTDEAGNVIFPYQCDAERELLVVMAHMDVVCPDTGKLPLRESDGCLIGPGVRDDTANLVNMLMTIKFLLKYETEKLCDEAAFEDKEAIALYDKSVTASCDKSVVVSCDKSVAASCDKSMTALCSKQMPGILFVADVGEEGLGNLRGSRQIWKDYGSRICEWICFDLNYNVIYNRAVGSRRYRISVHTEGGHSYKDFGKENAIAQLAEVIIDLYRVQLPKNVKVTYNVGKIEGGTTVNTIAQEAFMLYEFRSESEEAMQYMEHFLQKTLQSFRQKGIRIDAEIMGIRPGNGMVDHKKQEALTRCCQKAIRKYYEGNIICDAGSTDGNIPLSHGIPSVTIGTAFGEGTHTRQEWVAIESMKTGQKIAIELMTGKTGILK